MLFVTPQNLADYRAQVQAERDAVRTVLTSCKAKGAPGVTDDVMQQLGKLSDQIDAWAAETFPVDFTNFATEYAKGQPLEGELKLSFGPIAKQCSGFSGQAEGGLSGGEGTIAGGGAAGVLAKVGALTGLVLLVGAVGVGYVAVKYGRKAIVP